ncbi:AfsR/SARP family transcriptional regulator [Jidongwangia harbinensis]|uniref:AfsR/SARP family transcriptional regulator n=1 Tax=Jidongwangia harbinensis TaxID=2878561 RepID=UPI001CD9B427|nr:BTAD domain-containing putative transcriptional regulator [Jidongwangia harbinensis]MCA2219074.1 SARP family transcriptional regulator [Jidongwangia harbinensis]
MEITADSTRVPLGAARQQIVLGNLLLEANRVVPISRLIDAIYGVDVPSTARVQTQICISSLRRLFASHGRPDAIQTRSQGYVLQIDHPDLDMHRHDSLVARARAEADADRPRAAARDYRAALALWRGPVLQGLDSAALRAAAGAVNERRITVTEDCIEIELGLGLQRDLVGELTELIAAHPLRERLRGQLMIALYRSGRRAEALEAYQAARRSLVEDLGLEPSEWLRQLQHLILVADAGLRSPAPSVAPAHRPVASVAPLAADPGRSGPRLLPTDIGDFVGFGDQLDTVRQVLTAGEGGASRRAVPIVVLVGRAGAGKTTLAVHAAHLLAETFPGGQLFADLHGRTAEPVDPAMILGRFLRALSEPAEEKSLGLDHRAERYRARLADRRTLIVLDDAAGEEQVRPLLPGARFSAVLVTSRRWLPGLPGAVHIGVDVLDRAHSVELLARMVGSGRVDAEPTAAGELAELCGDLPLALRIAGARLAGRPHWRLRRLADRLADDDRLTDELVHGGMSVRDSLAMAVSAMPVPAQRLFRLLGLLDFPAVSGWAGAALLGVPVPEVNDLLDSLSDAHLLDIVVAPADPEPRYRFHRVFGSYARAEGRVHESPECRRDAVGRALSALAALAREAHRRLGGPALPEDAQDDGALPGETVRRLIDTPHDWFERERLTLLAGIRQAVRSGHLDVGRSLAISTAGFAAPRTQQASWREAHEFALDVILTLGHQHGNAQDGVAITRYPIRPVWALEEKRGRH